MHHDDETLRSVYERAVPDDAEPLYCVVAGSHLHGTAGPDSDVDLRGVHAADAERYALLDQPAARVVVNQDGVTHGFEDVPDVEVVTRELRTFAELVAEGNFNVLEALFADDPLVDARPAAMADLRALVRAHLPLGAARGYVGMARQNYERATRGTERPTAKTYLHVLRALLAARYVLAEGDLEPDARALAEHGLDDSVPATDADADLVGELVAVKRSGADARPDDELAARTDRAVEALFEAVELPDDESDGARAAVDDWLRTVRA